MSISKSNQILRWIDSYQVKLRWVQLNLFITLNESENTKFNWQKFSLLNDFKGTIGVNIYYCGFGLSYNLRIRRHKTHYVTTFYLYGIKIPSLILMNVDFLFWGVKRDTIKLNFLMLMNVDFQELYQVLRTWKKWGDMNFFQLVIIN